jgi:hypothetical protein
MFHILGVTQNDINSPYSSFGIGNLSPRTNNVLGAMGGVGYAIQNPYHINFKNPAAFAAFDSLSFIADLSFDIVNHQLKTERQEISGTFAQLGYLALGLPVLRVWRMSAGIMPYSDIGYGIIDTTNSSEHFGNITNRYTGSGGLQLLYWGNAFKICKGFTLGVNLSYLFGSMNKTRHAEYSIDNVFNTIFSNFRHIDGIYISGGAQYQTTVKEKHHVGIGVVYENAIKVWSRENLLIINYNNQFFDTIAINVGKNAIRTNDAKMPHIVGAGLSYGYRDRLLIATDFTWQNWKRFYMSNANDSLKDNFITAVGVQYIPNPMSSKYHNRINYRLGTRVATGYLMSNDKSISEFAVSVGVGFPLRTFNFRSSINIMFEYSKLGTLKNDLILQNYYKLSFNFILQEKWHQRRKLD